MNNNDTTEPVKSSFSPYDIHEKHWYALFNELCYEVFYCNEKGRQLLAHLENKYFRSPVAFPAREPSWAYFNEGRNEMIRAFTQGIQMHLTSEHAKATAKTNPIPRRARLKPISNEG